MMWANARLKDVAPSRSSDRKFAPEEEVWHLTLDQIESNTGEIINKQIKPAKEAGSSTYVFDENNVLYSKLRPYLNKVVCPTESGIATTELIPLRPNQELIDRRYLTYYLRSPEFVRFASATVAGVKMPRVIMKTFWEHELPLPPLKEQRRIVEILDQADALRKQRAEADKKAARILPALFYQMFGDPVSNPRGLRKEPLKKLIKVKSGNFLPAKEMDPVGKYPVYGGNGISGYHSEFMFEEPVIVLGRVGVYCGAVHYSKPRSWVTDNALYVSEKSDELLDGYLLEALRLADLNQYAGRAGQPLISGSRIYPVEILVPDLQLQRDFAERSQGVEELLDRERRSLDQLNKLFRTLLYRAFSGVLTAKWREVHMKELLQEIECQAQTLGITHKTAAGTR